MGNVIAGAEEVTPEWLTAILREKGALARGRVTRVTPDETESTFASSVSRLEVGYTEDASPGAPRRLFLKASSPALAPGEFDPAQTGREYIFYRHVAPMMRAAFTIPCYDAGHEPESGATHILLKDVSETHAACRDPLCGGNCEAAIDALASLHAFWWDHLASVRTSASSPPWRSGGRDGPTRPRAPSLLWRRAAIASPPRGARPMRACCRRCPPCLGGIRRAAT